MVGAIDGRWPARSQLIKVYGEPRTATSPALTRHNRCAAALS
jgi:hypothetical protein